MRLVPFAFALLALPAAAQTAPPMLAPGSPGLAEAPPQSYTYEVRIAADVPRVLGHLTYTETLDGGRLTIVSHTEMQGGAQTQRDTTVVAWPGLQPLARSSDDGEERARVVFADGRIQGRRVLGNLDEALDAPLPEGVFAEGVGSRLARMLPFTDGYTATVRFASTTGDVTTDTLRVAGPEAYTHADGTAASVWRVVRTAAARPATTYLVDGATRALLASSFSPRADLAIEIAPPAPPPSGPVLRPGDPSLVTGWMADGETAFAIRVVEPMQMDAGTSTVRRVVAGGEVTVETTVRVPMQGMEITTVSRADAATLAPRAHTSAGGPAAQALAFTATAVTGTTTPAEGEAAAVEVALAAPVFDAAMAAEVAQSLPFAEGYAATVEAYDARLGVHAIAFRVTGQSEIDGAAAWTVEASSPAGPVTYVVDAATRRLVSMRMSPQPGVVVEMGQP